MDILEHRRLSLSDAEWELLTELLERERRALPIEIRHCDTRVMRDQLRRRVELVDTILDRLKLADTLA